MKLCALYPQDQEKGPQEEPNSTSWAGVSQLWGQMRLARALSSQVLKNLPGFSASLGTMLQNLLVLMLKKLFLVTTLNLCCSNLCPPPSSFCQAPLWTAWPCLFISPHRCEQADVVCPKAVPIPSLYPSASPHRGCALAYSDPGGPQLSGVFQVHSNTCWTQGSDHFPPSPGCAPPNTAQDATGLLYSQGQPLAHAQPAECQGLSSIWQSCSPACQSLACIVENSQNLLVSSLRGWPRHFPHAKHSRSSQIFQDHLQQKPKLTPYRY